MSATLLTAQKKPEGFGQDYSALENELRHLFSTAENQGRSAILEFMNQMADLEQPRFEVRTIPACNSGI